MGERTLVPDAGEVVLDQVLDQMVVEGRSRLVMVLRPAGGGSVCPECQQASRRIHSRYRRRLNDLPWEGLPMRIELRVRRFFCETKDCEHHIFTERLPKIVKHYARRTCRLSEALERIALVLGGSAGSRLAEQLGILASDSTLLRQLRRKRPQLSGAKTEQSFNHGRSAPRVSGATLATRLSQCRSTLARVA